MSYLEDAKASLRTIMKSATPATREEIAQAIDLLNLAERHVHLTTTAEYPPCLESLTAEQKQAVNDLCGRFVVTAVKEWSARLVVETARLAAQHAQSKH